MSFRNKSKAASVMLATSAVTAGALVLAKEALIVEPNPCAEPPPRTVPCEVLRVVDGDTIWVRCELLKGDTYRRFKIRPVGIDTPERFTARGKLATKYTQGWVDASSRRILFEDHGADKYGERRNGVVYSPAGGPTWSEALRAAGHEKVAAEE